MQQFRALFEYRKHNKPIRDLPLLEVLEKLGNGYCSEPMDHVYGLLGLVREEERLQVDYDIPRDELVRATCEMLVRVDPNLEQNEDRIGAVGTRLMLNLAPDRAMSSQASWPLECESFQSMFNAILRRHRAGVN
jgi:hypothetical protein